MKISTTRDFLRSNSSKLTMLFFSCCLYFFSYFHRVGIPGTIFNELQSAFGMSAGAVTMLGAIYLYVYGSMQLPAGMLIDRFGSIKTLMLGGLILSVGCVLFPLMKSSSSLLWVRALIGFSGSFMYLSIVKEIDELFDSKYFAALLGIALFLGYSGGMAGTFPFERAVKLMGWRQALFSVGILCSLFFLLYVYFVRKTGRLKETRGKAPPLILKKIIENRDSYPLFFSAVANFAIYFTIQATIGKKMLEDCFSTSSKYAAFVTFNMMLVLVICSFVSGFVLRYIGNKRKPMILAGTIVTLLSTTIMIFFLRSGTGAGWFFLSYILLALSSAFTQPTAISLMKETSPSQATGTAIGFVNGTCYLAIAVMTNFTGFAMDLYRDQAVITKTAVMYPIASYGVILQSCFIIAFLSFISSLFIRESYGKNIYKEKKY